MRGRRVRDMVTGSATQDDRTAAGQTAVDPADAAADRLDAWADDERALEEAALAIARARRWRPEEILDAQQAGTLPYPEARAAIAALRSVANPLDVGEWRLLEDALGALLWRHRRALQAALGERTGDWLGQVEQALEAGRQVEALRSKVGRLAAQVGAHAWTLVEVEGARQLGDEGEPALP